MAKYVDLPQMTDTMTEGVISAWLKDEGDEVRAGDPIAEIETDKAVMELEAPTDGVLLKRYIEEQEEVACGTIVAAVGEAGEEVEESPAPVALIGAAEDAPPPAPAPEAEKPAPPAQPEAARTAEEPSRPQPPSQPPTGRIKASPVARRTAEAAGVDLASVAGTGPDGRIVKRDVEAAVAVSAPVLEAETVQVSRRRRIMIDRLVETHQSVPSFTVTRHFDCDRLASFREELKSTAEFAGGIGFTELVVKASAMASAREPALNARYAGDAIQRIAEVNVGVAVGLDEGVIVPVIRGCERKSLREIVSEFRRLTEKARNGTLLADELGGSTFTVSNLGMFGVDEFTAVINAPDAAILALGAVKDKPIVRSGEVALGKVMSGTLTVDHRVADGVGAARWMAELADLLANPVNLIV